MWCVKTSGAKRVEISIQDFQPFLHFPPRNTAPFPSVAMQPSARPHVAGQRATAAFAIRHWMPIILRFHGCSLYVGRGIGSAAKGVFLEWESHWVYGKTRSANEVGCKTQSILPISGRSIQRERTQFSCGLKIICGSSLHLCG